MKIPTGGGQASYRWARWPLSSICKDTTDLRCVMVGVCESLHYRLRNTLQHVLAILIIIKIFVKCKIFSIDYSKCIHMHTCTHTHTHMHTRMHARTHACTHACTHTHTHTHTHTSILTIQSLIHTA